MEIGPIFRALIQKKFGVLLLVAEIAVTLAVVLNCINLVVDNRKRLMIPSGVDEENIIVLSIQSYGDAFEEDEFGDQIRQQDLDLVPSPAGRHRRHPDQPATAPGWRIVDPTQDRRSGQRYTGAHPDLQGGRALPGNARS